MMHKNKSQSGVSLLEALLSVIVITLLITVVLQLIQNQTKQNITTAAAKYFNQVYAAAYIFVAEKQNFQQLYTVIADPANPTTNILEIGLEDAGLNYAGISMLEGGSGVIGANNLLDFDSALTPGGGPLRQNPRLLIRLIDGNPSTVVFDNEPQVMEFLIVSDIPVSDADARGVAAKIGVNGGIVSANTPGGECIDDISGLPVNCETLIRSAFGLWRIARNIFLNTDWNSDVTTEFATLTGENRENEFGYIAMYRFVHEDHIDSDYLHRRVNAAGADPELHRMHSEIDMGNFRIEGVDNMRIGNNLNIKRNVVAKGSAIIEGDVTIGRANSIEGDDFFGGGNLVLDQGDFAAGTVVLDRSPIQQNVLDLAGDPSNTVAIDGNTLINNRMDVTQDISANSAEIDVYRGNISSLANTTITGDLIGNDAFEINAVNMLTNGVNVSGTLQSGRIISQTLVINDTLDLERIDDGTGGNIIANDVAVSVNGDLTGLNGGFIGTVNVDSATITNLTQCWQSPAGFSEGADVDGAC